VAPGAERGVSLSFANPLLAWGLLAALIPVIVHLFFRKRPRPTPFPAIDFILKARRETERRLKLRRILLFVARTALLAAVALAIARPRLLSTGRAAAAAAAGPSATAIVLDASGSMRYRLGGKALFERARADALEALDALGLEEPATAVVCDGSALPAATLTFDRAAVRRALREAEPSAGHSDLTACVAAAARALSEAAPGLSRRMVVATDLAASAWRLDSPAPLVRTAAGPVRPEVTVLDAARGADLPNAAVVDLTVEPDPAVGPRGYRLVGTLANWGKEPLRDLPVALRVGAGAEAAPIRAFAEVPAGGTARKTFSYAFRAGGPAVVSASIPGDALGLDDAAWLTLDVPREVKALIVDGAPSPVKVRDEAFFLEAALASTASPVRPRVVDAEELPRVRFADWDVIFLLNVRSLGSKASELRAFVERGGGLFIALGDQVDPEQYDVELGSLLPQRLHVVKTAAERGAADAADRAARFAGIAWDHPALSVFVGAAREGLESVRTFRYMLLRPPEREKGGAARSEHVIVSYDDGAPALVEARRGLGRVVLYTSTVDREWSDWTIRTSFLPAMQRLAAWLAGELEQRPTAPSVVGEPRAVPAPSGKRVVGLVGPDRRERAAKGGSLAPDLPGLWQVKVEEGGATRLDPSLAFAVRADPRESDTRRLEPSELTAWFGGATHARVAAETGGGESRSVPLWSILLAIAVAAFLSEGLLLA